MLIDFIKNKKYGCGLKSKLILLLFLFFNNSNFEIIADIVWDIFIVINYFHFFVRKFKGRLNQIFCNQTFINFAVSI